jgi:hypothetical protein
MVDKLGFDEIMNVQRMMASRIAQENEVNIKIKILDILNDLGAKKKPIHIDEVVLEARYQNVSENVVLDTLNNLEEDHMIIINSGKIKLTY